MNPRKISEAYWPKSAGPNPSADIEAGNKVVDSLTLNELTEFFSIHSAGPTFVLVRQRFLEQLKKLPPTLEIESARKQAQHGLSEIRTALSRIQSWNEEES